MAAEEIHRSISQTALAKRTRLDNDQSEANSPASIDNMDDVYGTDIKSDDFHSVYKAPTQNTSVVTMANPGQIGIPGLGRLGNAPVASTQSSEALPPLVVADESIDTGANLSVTEESSVEVSGVERSTVSTRQQITEMTELGGPETGTDANPVSVNHASGESNAVNSKNQPVTHALEALLGGLDSPAADAADTQEVSLSEGQAVAGADGNPEWEVDSSPYESSSDDSSSDESSSDADSDEDEDNTYKLLSPEEQARILMEGDGGSDDEGGAAKTKGTGGQLRTKNEIPDEAIPKPDVTITPEMRIEELGMVEAIVENLILIKAKISGEYRALESGSILCLGDRSVIGVVSETLGRVQQPLYTVQFTNDGEITEAGVSVGTKVFYSEQHAKFALTQALKAYKGSDASNLHDEEVGDEEMEFSDDEAEMEHKRRIKQKKLEKRGGRIQQNGGHGRAGPHGHPSKQQELPGGNGQLSYDEAEDDGPYKPLARPTGFADTIGRVEAPQEAAYTPGMSNRGRGDLRGRGRSDRGRGRGDRGRGRGTFQDRRDNNGYSQPPQGSPSSGYGAPQTSLSSQTLSTFSPGTTFAQSPLTSPNPNSFYRPGLQGQHSPQQPMWPQFSPQQFQQPYQAFQNMQNGWPSMPPPPPLPSGGFINPAFFAGNQHPTPNPWQQLQQSGRGRGSSSS